MAKLSLYRYFTNALALSVVLSFVWVVYEMWFKVTDAFRGSGKPIGSRGVLARLEFRLDRGHLLFMATDGTGEVCRE